ncbi:flagellar biosynthesis protein FlhA [Candidatus Poribacteria bacterium]|nr:flagellar biosynthesis protein FlhA [Candidatus Poribacteria bacterium]
MGTQQKEGILNRIIRNSDVALAAGVVAIILIMLIPLPPMLLDLMLSFNITFALTILLISLYALRPLDFSVFPSLLLVSTLLRLSMNVSSTRLILLHGNEGEAAAGKVIKSFGNFVVGGNYVVGFVVFLIIVVIQFIVITKGSGRIAEVAARFTLDAMPGKQMSIDADLNAGLITESEARERRHMISREADFYGAMDGASKFVRGDAIAGIIIMFIDIIGGLIIGVTSHGMGIGQAARVYAILTIGDGLVSQLPALIISTASGMIVSRAASESNFGKELSFQFFTQPKAFAIAAGMLFIMGLVPGLPKMPFLLLAGISGVVAYVNRNGPVVEQDQLPEAEEEQEEEEPAEENLEQLMEIDPMELEISHTLIPLVDPDENGKLLERIKLIRRQCALELGFITPPIRIRDNIQLKSGEYDILIRGVKVADGEILMGYYMAMNPGTAVEDIEGIETQEPVFGLSAKWISEELKDTAEISGYTVVDSETILATHLTEIIKRHAHELFGRQELKSMLDKLKESHPAVVDEVIPNIISMSTLHKVLKNLLREHVSIRDMVLIMECLADVGEEIKDADVLTEYVRQVLSRSLVKPLLDNDGVLKVLTLDPVVEETITDALAVDNATDYASAALRLDPNTVRGIINATATAISRSNIDGQPIVLCSSPVRVQFKRMTEQYLPALTVLAYNEIPANTEIQQVGVVKLQLNENNS